MKTFVFQVRAAQLDLARQMETVDFIKGFIDFIADNGYNTLALYLEGRIRTASFPFPSESESYTPDQMKSIVRYAEDKAIDVIPVIPAMGHAESFFKYAELAALAETRNGVKGRFGSDFKHVFCPSSPQTYQFLDRYLSEISGLFPSPYLHVGCDEAWDIGCCDLCRGRLQRGEAPADLYARHLQKLHCIVAEKLGKRMIVWDDMFEFYPEALNDLPRDIILACWQYQENVEKTRGHFANRVVIDSLAHYDRLGFNYLICPADYTIHNAESFTVYAARRKPLGGWLTTWEKSTSFLLKSLPLIAAVGRLWASGVGGPDGPTFQAVVKNMFGIDEPRFVQSIKAMCSCGFHPERRSRPNAYFTRGENNFDYGRARLVDMLLTVFPTYLDKVKQSARDALEDMILTLRVEQIDYDFNKILSQLLTVNADIRSLMDPLRAKISELEALGQAATAMWHRIRPGIVPCTLSKFYDDWLKTVRETAALAAESGFLKVHFMLPDQYSAQHVRVLIHYHDAPSWETLADGVFKELASFDCFYSRLFPIAKDRVPVGLKIETWGFGGQGFTYFEAENNRGRFAPVEVRNIIGTVADPENVLTQDWTWAFAGEKNALKAFRNAELAITVHGFEIELRSAE